MPELVWLSSIMTADLIITVSILYGLIRSKTGWAHTDKIVTKLIRMTVSARRLSPSTDTHSLCDSAVDRFACRPPAGLSLI